MIQYSIQSRRAVARLFQPYNDIDVFVEDSTYVGVYEKFINRILSGRAKVTKVIPLGSKSTVVQAAHLDVDPAGRKRIYIVDGDLDLIAWYRQRAAPRLYRLRVYSLENLFFQPDAMSKYCAFASPGLAEGACSRSVNTVDLVASVELLVPYITLLAIAHRLGIRNGMTALNPPSVSQTVGHQSTSPDVAKMRLRCKEIIGFIISEVGVTRYRLAKQAVQSNLATKKIADHRIIPGKPFGLAYLNGRIQAAGGVALSQKMIVSYLAEHSSIKSDKQFVRRLRRLVGPDISNPST